MIIGNYWLLPMPYSEIGIHSNAIEIVEEDSILCLLHQKSS
jgi:hypothetical protein